MAILVGVWQVVSANVRFCGSEDRAVQAEAETDTMYGRFVSRQVERVFAGGEWVMLKRAS